MLESDITFLLFFGIACMFFTLCIFIWRGILWLSFISGAMWIMFGMFFNTRIQDGEYIMEFQEYMPIVLIAIGIAMILSPLWLKTSKQLDLEKDAPDDIHIFGKDEDMWDEGLREYGIKPKNERKSRY